MALSDEEKRKIIEALEEDKEFRYTLMGLLSFKEILDRITRLEERYQRIDERIARLEERFAKLEERQQKLEERFAELEERFARLEERQQRLEEKFAELEERFAKLEERQQRLEERFVELEEKFARLEERQQKLEERFAKLEERQQRLEEKFARLEERQYKLEEEMRETRRVLITIAHRFGILSEAGFREAMKYVVEEVFGTAIVEKKSLKDTEGIVYGHEAVIDIDVLIRDKEHIIIEVKSRVSRGDIVELYRIGKLYEKTYKVKPRLVIIGGFIDTETWVTASKLGVEIKPAFKT
ncbi:MAG: DUF3782 domain-containing protein [Staphylothermus sp.]|nr:DUF3782 domain-containing protein [Staphylothermus sp.]